MILWSSIERVGGREGEREGGREGGNRGGTEGARGGASDGLVIEHDEWMDDLCTSWLF